jgi:autotransporter-associated beta strand protein
MKKKLALPASIALLAVAAPLICNADTFFTDNFANGSTVNAASIPGGTPTASSTSYDIASTKNATASTIASGFFTMKLNAATTSGFVEAQAIFSSSSVALSTVNDYVDVTVVFTNSAGTLLIGSGSSFLWLGLFDSGGSMPVAGNLANAGLTTTAGSAFATGNCANWKGYFAQISNGGTSRMSTRPVQDGAGTTSANQDLLANNAGGGAFNNPAGTTIGTGPTTAITLATGGRYTLYLRLTLTAASTLSISNSLYSGTDLGATPLFSQQATISGATFLTSSFDGLGIGMRHNSGSQNPQMDIASITIQGQSTAITTPPDILTQPVSVTVPAGGSSAFNVTAQGFGMTYQWKRHGTNLINGGNISGANSDMLIISPVSAADVASGGNGYSVTITGTGGFTTNSQTASLALGTAKDLVWSGSGNVWDLNNSANWLDPINPATFNYGDAVTLGDAGAINGAITLTGNYLSASSVTVDTSAPGFDYSFVNTSTGGFAGPGQLIYKGAGLLTMNNANSYTGGTIISNASAYLIVGNYNALGSGPVTLAKAGGTMEIVPTGGATTGVKGDVNVQDDFTIQFNGSGSFATVFLGNLGGTAGKTLTLNPLNVGNTNRIRVYGTATTNDANLTINGLSTPYAAGNGTVLAPYNGTGIQIYNGVISGNVGIIQRGSGVTVFAGQNTYAGGTVPSTGTIGIGANSTPTSGTVTSSPLGSGALLIAPEIGSANGSGTILAWGGARTIANPIQYPSATNNQTLIIGGTNALTLNGAYTLNGNDGQGTSTNRILQVNNTALTTIASSISGAGFGLTKTGSGTLALNGNNTFDGRTSISNGTVNLNGSLAGPVLVVTNSILGGSGTINGEVTVLAGGRIAPGNSIGTLTINNNLSLAGHLNIEVNRSGLASDKVVVSGTLNNGGTGTVTVTNLGTVLQAGDSFALFNKALANGNAMAVTGGNVIWTNKLAVDGTIAVVTAISSTPTNISYAVSGNTLTLSWPQDHLTWILQSNSVGLTSTNSWFPVSGSANSTQQIITVDPTKQNVFYRLIAP